MAELTAALRFVHFAAAIALAGELAFLLWIARSSALLERGRRIGSRWLALALVSGVLWFFVQAAVMSGGPAFDAAAFGTLFGRVAVARLVLALALGVALVFTRGQTARLALCGALAALLLASLAATGHAAAEQDTDRIVHLAADAAHLLAAGAWLGALPALAFTLREGAEIRFAERATRRFSTLGLASVATLVATGAVNAWYTVSDLPALFGTAYGQLLCTKLALFAAMLAFAAVNRLRWTPRLGAADAALALRRLRRNCLAEISLGLGVLGIVAALGVTIPALHAKILWPFSYTLDPNAAALPAGIVPAALALVFLASATAVLGAVGHRGRVAAASAALCAAALLGLAGLFAVPAHPSTYFESPVLYSAASVVRGAPLYAEHCERCHGAYGNGDGPHADSLPRRPPNLASRLAARREGDLLWSIENGVAGTTMPAFRERIAGDGIWDVLAFIRAQANVDAGRRLDGSVTRWRPVTAPDFTFQIGRGAQESLAGQRGRYIVLLVFYSPPHSLPRLRELAVAKPSRLARMGVRVIAVPIAGRVPRGAKGTDATMLAEPDAGLVDAYAMFTRTIVGPPAEPARHVEFLIDRQGYIRARSLQSGTDTGWSTIAELLRESVILSKETSRAPAPRRHAH